MTDDDLDALLPALEGFHARFGRFFRRSEGRAFGRQYLIGLALPIERKNAENIAEQVGAPPRKLQEFLSDSPWDEEGCIGELQRFVGEQFGAPDGVLILDDTDFAKKGIHSGWRGPPVLGHPRAGRQLPGRGVPGLCQPPRSYPGRSAAVPH